MKVYTVLAIFGGVPTTVESFSDPGSAQRRGLELADECGLLAQPQDWEKEDGKWDTELGSRRVWQHHWYSHEHDVLVAECDVE